MVFRQIIINLILQKIKNNSIDCYRFCYLQITYNFFESVLIREICIAIKLTFNKNTMKRFYLILFIFTFKCFGQEIPKEFTYNEFLGYVKKFHPLVKTANLELNRAQANLMMARGSFDPKIEVDFDKKQFKDTDYYSILNSSFKIPTWYGIELKAGFDTNSKRGQSLIGNRIFRIQVNTFVIIKTSF